ncbi:MAG: 2-C-methyl-D-erythritol 4-phosphate cytidylyltransferase [Pyrinomonadaceae bacterium]
MNIAIIAAAGSGTRFGGEKPKQFVEVLGKPVIIHTLERFESCPAIDRIILVLSPDFLKEFARVSEKFSFNKLEKVIAGGKTRAESVRNGLSEIDGKMARIVAVHDGARPLITISEIARTVKKAEQTGAACLVAPMTDTVKKVERGRITGTINRENLRRAQTPQCFRYQILKDAFAGADLGESATDECFLVERTGRTISPVEGGPRNIKVTTPEDLILAEYYLRQMAENAE